jgi:DNA-binding response OmpR family regulator
MTVAVPTVLIIEDNEDLALGLRVNLEAQGYRVELARDGAAGLAQARALHPALVILDLMLPTLDGYQVLRSLRAGGFDAPVLILTARNQEGDKIRGFRVGADDYVTKPFSLRELLARVEVMLHRIGRNRSVAPDAALRFGDVEVDVEARVVRRGGDTVQLTPMALDLLIALYHRRGKSASRLELLRDVWGYGDDIQTRTVDSHVYELRRKLEPDPTRPRYLRTVWGLGYRLDI